MPDFPTGQVLVDCIPGLEEAELVNTGGQKAVYKAQFGGEIVALKVIGIESDQAIDDDDDAGGSERVQRAKREFAILNTVDVPVLTKRGPVGLDTIRIGDDSWLFFTEEWIEGGTLREIIGGGQLLPRRVASLGLDLILAVQWLSDRGLIHRDIKPENIMLRNDSSRFVLLDPGIALDLEGPSLTQMPIPMGTTAYLSPEQMDPYKKRELDFRSDLFSIGVVMYESSTGQHPFREGSVTISEVISGILNRNPLAVSDRVDDFPDDLSAFIMRLLGKSPNLRYRKCEYALGDIDAIVMALGVDE